MRDNGERRDPMSTLAELLFALFEPLVHPIHCRLEEVERKIDKINHKVNRLLGMELGDARRDKMANQELDRIMQEVSENRDAVASVETLVQSLAQQIRDSAGNEEALKKLADELDANTGRLGKVVTDNTPFQPSGQ